MYVNPHVYIDQWLDSGRSSCHQQLVSCRTALTCFTRPSHHHESGMSAKQFEHVFVARAALWEGPEVIRSILLPAPASQRPSIRQTVGRIFKQHWLTAKPCMDSARPHLNTHFTNQQDILYMCGCGHVANSLRVVFLREFR